MAGRTSPSVVLLSVLPRYAKAILAGRKMVEFRKAAFRRPVSHVAIYACRPMGALVAVCEVGDLDTDTPGNLWERYSKIGGISREDYDAYYRGVAQGVAIRLAGVRELGRPMQLNEVRANLKAPQNWAYLKDADTERLLS